jgi:hypothetical protein
MPLLSFRRQASSRPVVSEVAGIRFALLDLRVADLVLLDEFGVWNFDHQLDLIELLKGDLDGVGGRCDEGGLRRAAAVAVVVIATAGSYQG